MTLIEDLYEENINTVKNPAPCLFNNNIFIKFPKNFSQLLIPV